MRHKTTDKQEIEKAHLADFGLPKSGSSNVDSEWRKADKRHQFVALVGLFAGGFVFATQARALELSVEG